MQAINTTLKPNQALIFRLTVGAIFGFLCGWLGKTQEMPHHLPDLWINVALSTLMLGAFVLWAGAGTMRRLSLAAWGVVALATIAFIALNHATHGLPAENGNVLFFDDHALIYPFLFIAHELVSSADMTGKPVAPYSLYFDQAWKRGVQLALAVLFTGLFWGILWLGAALLDFIGFNWLRELLENQYFIGPTIGMALGAAVQLGDVQARLLGQVRAVALGVLSWLLPVITLIGLIFAASLCVSGLKPLWATNAASLTLLSACVALALLINAVYEQGDEERPVHAVLKWAARLASGLLLAFALLAAHSLHLRIHQYGLTPERVMATVGVFLALLYGLGYAYAAVSPRGRWMAGLERVNVGLAFVMVVLFAALLTPVAEPVRISVASQVARLQSGRVTPDRFDWQLLRFKAGTYGTEALDRLVKDGRTQAIRDAAAKAKATTDETLLSGTVVPDTGKPDPARLAVVLPQGAALPQDFLAGSYKMFAPGTTSNCLSAATTGATCYAAMVDLNHDDKPEILVLDGNQVTIYTRGDAGWRDIDGLYIDDSGVAAFQKGKISTAKPDWDDVVIGDSRQTVNDVRK